MARFAIPAAVAALLCMFQSANAEQFRLRELHPDIRRVILEHLAARGVEPGPAIMTAITTSDCPENCDDKVAGGMCLCAPENGVCPDGTEKVPGEEQCRVRPVSARIGGGSLGAPVEVQTSGF